MNAEPPHDPLGVFLGVRRPPDESAVAAWAREAMPRDLHAAWRNAAKRVGWLVPDHGELRARDEIARIGGAAGLARVLVGEVDSWTLTHEFPEWRRHPGPRATWWIWRFARPDRRKREWSPVVASAWAVETGDGRRPWERLDVFPSRAAAVDAAMVACGFQGTVQETLF